MPTGYTADVQSGKITSFPQFAMQCARAFGALIELRDEPLTTPIPADFKPDTAWHDQEIAKAIADIARLNVMSLDEAAVAAEAEYHSEMAHHVERRAEKVAVKARYDAMLKEVVAWEPPSSKHEGLKDFMADQLSQSIKYDCYDWPDLDPPPAPEIWLAQALATAHRNVAYHQEERCKKIERAAARTRWVKQLRESLVAVPKAKTSKED